MSRPLDSTLAAVWRIESARVVATVARRVHDLGVAEELAQDAWLEALQRWPADGLPDKPGAWLMTTAQRKALDWLRHRQMAAGHEAALAQDLIAMQADRQPDHADTLDARRAARSVGGDELLRLLFTACHPLLPPAQRVALTLKVLAGLSTGEIARAFLVSEPTMAQRLVRAKRTLAEARVPCELPGPDALAERLGSVLEVVYLVFNEGYTATAGEDWMRPALCDEALRLGRMLVQLAPTEPEAWGLLALMSLQASRTAARTERDGRPILLADQDRRRWDRLLIRHGLEALARADALAAGSPGSYQLQAALAACHARAARAGDTDWARICTLYERLMQRSPSPVVALNHAVAVGMHQGPAAALALVEALQHEPALAAYPWLPAVQGDLLARLGHRGEARQAWLRAAELSTNQRERQSLLERAQALDHPRTTDEPA